MICGAEDLIRVCREKDRAGAAYAVRRWPLFPGKKSNAWVLRHAPMAQIGKGFFYEDLTADRLAELIDAMAARSGAAPWPAGWPLLVRGEDRPERADQPAAPGGGGECLGHAGVGNRRYAEAHRRHRSADPDAVAGYTARAEVAQEEKIIVADTADAAVALATGTKPVGLTAARDGQPDDRRTSWASGRSWNICCTSWGFTISTRLRIGPRTKSPGWMPIWKASMAG